MDVKSTEGIITRGEFINTYLQIQIPIQRKSYTSKSQANFILYFQFVKSYQ